MENKCPFCKTENTFRKVKESKLWIYWSCAQCNLKRKKRKENKNLKEVKCEHEYNKATALFPPQCKKCGEYEKFTDYLK